MRNVITVALTFITILSVAFAIAACPFMDK